MHLFHVSTSTVVGSVIILVHSLLGNCNSIRSADTYASLMTLERYDVASCGECLTVRRLSLGRTPRVVHSFAVRLQTRFFDQQLCLSWVSFDLTQEFKDEWEDEEVEGNGGLMVEEIRSSCDDHEMTRTSET